ncbi:MAG TPA: tetratricopeptide repeat protein [Myxococcales bacterium]|nr:tetratricopeptide repeat protein [Myxococcales bacterium]
MRFLIVAVLLASPAFAQTPVATPAPAPAASGWQANFDQLWKRRDEPGVIAQLHQIVDAEAASKSFDANWRLASLYNWEANNSEGDKKAGLGHKGWDAADLAIVAKPGDVRAQYFGATGIGLYAEGVGVLTALSQGLEGKFKERIQAAMKIDKDYADGAPQVVWGRFFFKLPWPKRDVDQSIRVLTPLMDSHPHNLRAKLYLAESLTDEGSVEDARKLVQQIIDAPPGDDPPETRLLQTQAKKWMASH